MIRLRSATAAVLLLAASVTIAQPKDRPQEVNLAPALVRIAAPTWAPESQAECQLAGMLDCGETATGDFSTGDCLATNGSYFDYYGFFGLDDQLVRVEAFAGSSSMEILVTLHDGGDGEVFAQARGFGSAAIARPLPYGGDFIVAVTAVQPGARGSYSLKLTCPDDSSGPPCVWSGTASCGAPINGILESSDCPAGDRYDDFYKLALVEGDTVEIKATAGFPLYVELYLEDPDNVFLGTYRSGLNQQALIFTAERTGTYGLQVGSVQQLVGGAYTLEVNCLGANPCRRRSVRH